MCTETQYIEKKIFLYTMGISERSYEMLGKKNFEFMYYERKLCFYITCLYVITVLLVV